jgi:hypothetical protein
MNQINFSLVASLVLFGILASCRGNSNDGLNSTNTLPLPVIVVKKPPLKILIIGQSLSSNCNEFKFSAVTGINQVSLDGRLKPAADPFDWSDCKSGSMWMPLGDLLIKDGMLEEVVFMPIGIGGTKVSDWLPGGRAYPKLTNAMAIINNNSIKFDLVFWHQGSADNGNDPIQYEADLYKLIEYVNSKIGTGKWLIAQHSRCGSRFDPNIVAAQKRVADHPEKGLYPGPDTNILGPQYRFDGCHLNYEGQTEMARMWLKSIKSLNSIPQ